MIRIIHKDDNILVVDKPADLLSVPGRRPEHQDCLLYRLHKKYPEALIVHRLDMSTSGLMILARNAAMQRNLSRQFEMRQAKKTYFAVVSGKLEPDVGEIDLPLICDWPNRPPQIVDQSLGKPAKTQYQSFSYDVQNDCSRVELRPITGRTHQLRVHMQALGHPILGDDLYADQVTLSRSDRLLLHASGLKFLHPAANETYKFTLDAPF